jgi:hypothetical protein
MSNILWRPGCEPQLKLVYKHLAKQSGRDKIYRTLQYYGKYYEWSLLQSGDKERAKLAKHWASMISLARKLYRMVKWLENWHKAYDLAVTDTGKWDVEKVSNFGKNVTGGFYYWYDMFQWLHAAKLIVSADKQRLDDTRNYFWIARIVFTAVNLYIKLEQQNQKIAKAKSALLRDNKGTPAEIDALKFKRLLITLDAFRNTLDITAPVQSFKWFDWCHGGTAGGCGTIASLIGLHAVWNE